MKEALYVIHRYVTRILLMPMIAYTFLTYGCPACQYRIEQDSAAFFSPEYEKAAQQEKLLNQTALNAIENESEEESNA